MFHSFISCSILQLGCNYYALTP